MPGKVISAVLFANLLFISSCLLAHEFSLSSLAVEAERALYTELWKACAGPLVTVPRENELVFYFPQGHIEQVLLW